MLAGHEPATPTLRGHSFHPARHFTSRSLFLFLKLSTKFKKRTKYESKLAVVLSQIFKL